MMQTVMLPGFSLKKLFWKTFLALPLCFGLWYFTAALWVAPIAWMSNVMLRLLFPKLIAGVEQAGSSLDVVTNLGDLAQYLANQSQVALVVSINPLMYGYSLALYSALFLASTSRLFKSWLIGVGILLLAIIFGVCLDTLKQIAFDLAPPGMSYPTGFSGWQLNLIGVGYQLGYLVLPPVIPLILWLHAHKADLLVES